MVDCCGPFGPRQHDYASADRGSQRSLSIASVPPEPRVWFSLPSKPSPPQSEIRESVEGPPRGLTARQAGKARGRHRKAKAGTEGAPFVVVLAQGAAGDRQTRQGARAGHGERGREGRRPPLFSRNDQKLQSCVFCVHIYFVWAIFKNQGTAPGPAAATHTLFRRRARSGYTHGSSRLSPLSINVGPTCRAGQAPTFATAQDTSYHTVGSSRLNNRREERINYS